MLEPSDMLSDERKAVDYSSNVNLNKTMLKDETTVALLRKIFEKRLEKPMDWCFGTNQKEIELEVHNAEVGY